MHNPPPPDAKKPAPPAPPPRAPYDRRNFRQGCPCWACEAARGRGPMLPETITIIGHVGQRETVNMVLEGNNRVGQMILELTKPLLHRIELLERRIKELENG